MRFDIASSMADRDGDSLFRDWIALISFVCKLGNTESGMFGRLGAAFEIEIDDEGKDSGSNRADRTATSFEVRLGVWGRIVIAVAIMAYGTKVEIDRCFQML